MKFLKRNIPVKYLYMLSAMVALLVTLGLYTTYAMFTANVSSGNVVNMDTTLYYDFDISGTQSFHLTKKSIASFYATVNNTSQGAIYYEVYYTSNNDLSNVIIAEVVDDKTTTPTATNTSGNIDTNTSKDIPIVIANNSGSDIDIVIGVVSGNVGNTIVYGSDGYPNGTKITATYNKNDITNSCESGTNVNEDCYEEVENGYLVTYCPVASFLEDPSKANRPVLADGMIPVVHNGTTWVKANNKGNYNDWYDYGNKKWANAVMVSSATRDTYMTADIGTPVQEADILAYYVWIPRYKYQLFNVAYSGVSSQLINVQFESGTSSTGTVTCSVSEIGVETCTNKANGNWYTHPAFTFGDQQLPGIWVGKFETTYGTNTTNVYPSNTVYSTPTIKPNVTSLRNQQVSKQFQTAQYFGTSAYLTNTGVNEVDAHMMKNIEWGAVAYLKQSAYGLGTTDIAINNSSNFLTGKSSGNPAVTTSSATGSYSYNENKIVKTVVEGSGTNLSYNINNDTTYPWIQLTDGTYKSQTQGVKSSTTNLTVTFTLTDSGVISFDYSVSSESASYDYLYYTITNSSGTVIDSTGTSNKIGGTSYGSADTAMTFITKTHNLEAGSYTVVFTYRKDSSADKGTDAGYVKNIKVVENPEIIIETLPAGQLASTTGNITGVYDMVGGAWEYTMGVIQDNTTTGRSPMSGHSTEENSGYIGKVGSYYANSGNTLAFPAAKYYDLYANGTSSSDYARSHLGDATGETRSWYSDDASFAYDGLPWFRRGGYCLYGTSAGVFHFDDFDGYANAYVGFRVALSTTGA